MKSMVITAAWLWLILLLPHSALAHKVMVFAWVEGDTVHTESKFSGGKRVQGGKIEVFGHDGQPVIEGITDDQGHFKFERPRESRGLKIVLTSGMGHANHWMVTAEELGQAPLPARSAQQPPAGAAIADGGSAGLDASTIEQIVERSLEKKLGPLRAQLAQQSWGMRDIVAGVGYILGLMGLASYLHHRKKE